MRYHVYVSNFKSAFLSRFVFETDSGVLTPQSHCSLRSGAGALATNADGSRLYVCLRKLGISQVFSIDKATGVLAFINEAEAGKGSPYLGIDHTDRFLLAAHYGAGAVSVHALREDGAIGGRVQWIETEQHAHSIRLDRTNRFAYVPHTNPANAIYQFEFDGNTGRLSPGEPRKVQPHTPEGPRHLVFHPVRDVLYSVNENGSSVSAWVLDRGSGRLTPFQLATTLPDGFVGNKNTAAEIRITPDGNYLYASNRGHDSLAIYSVAADGALLARGHQSTEAGPRSFDIDPTGQYVFVVGQRSGYLSLYRIDDGGALQHLTRHRVGDSPVWVQLAEATQQGG